MTGGPPRVDDVPLELETVAELQDRDDPAPSSDEGEPPPRRRRLPAILALVLLILVFLEAGASLVQHMKAPSAGDWQAAAEKVRSQRKPGDPVLFAPLWVAPIGRLHLADLIDLEQQVLSDVEPFRRVFEVSVRSARHPWLRDRKPSSEWTFGGVNVALFENAHPSRVLFNFTRRIGEAQVSRIGHKVHRCTRRGDRFVCGPSWNWVGPHIAEVDHQPYRCIFAHAVDGHVMRITFPAARVGRALVGYTGIDDFENRKRAKSPVLLKIHIGPRQLGVVRHQNEWPWRRFTFDTSKFRSQTHPVSFEITTPHAYARTFCFSAETRE